MPKSLEDKIFDFRVANDMAKYATGAFSRQQSYAKQVELAGLRDAYDNAVAAEKAGLMKRAVAATIAADEEMWKMAMELNKGADSVTKSRIAGAATQANKTLDALKEYSPSDRAVGMSRRILQKLGGQAAGWNAATDKSFHQIISDTMMNESEPLSAADFNAVIGNLAFDLSFKPDELRKEMGASSSPSGAGGHFLRVWSAHENASPQSKNYLKLVGSYADHMREARGFGGNVGKLVRDFEALKKAHGRGDREAVDESYESISTIPTGEIETRQRILDEQSPATHQRAIFADKEFRDKMADYGYTDPGEFFVDYVENKGRTLRRRAPLPRKGPVITDGGTAGGSPDEVRAIEQGITDEDLAADLERQDIGRSQARTAEQADAEREWLAEYEKADAEEPPEHLSDREWYQWHVDKLLPLQNKLQRTIDPGSDFRKEWDEKLEAHLELAEVGVKESLEIEDEPFAEQGGQFMHEGQPIPIIAESDSARRRATAGALRGERPEHRPMSLKEISEGVKEGKFEEEVEDIAPAQEVAPPIPEPGMPAPEAPVQAPAAETTIDPDLSNDANIYNEAQRRESLEDERRLHGLRRGGLTPERIATLELLRGRAEVPDLDVRRALAEAHFKQAAEEEAARAAAAREKGPKTLSGQIRAGQ